MKINKIIAIIIFIMIAAVNLNADQWLRDAGGYTAYLAGETGDEAVGGLTINHSQAGGGDTLAEVGVMALGHD